MDTVSAYHRRSCAPGRVRQAVVAALGHAMHNLPVRPGRLGFGSAGPVVARISRPAPAGYGAGVAVAAVEGLPRP
ncbi:hypothetical protein IG631_03379 [Alternaria alternata]|nr:hypothetical protein IG631_03379 [Alternaria alternata]